LLLIMFLANNQQDTPPNLFFTYTRFEHNSRGLLRYIAMRHTNINVDLMSPLDYLTLVYWIDIFWLFSLLIRAYLLKDRSKK
ncbi:hypothetical protein Lfee_1520, partial [Legionella feeleii]